MMALRYRKVADLLTPVITAQSQQRLNRTLEDLYSKALAKSNDQAELAQNFRQEMIEKCNLLMAIENAIRIRQWTERILEEEAHYLEKKCAAETQSPPAPEEAPALD